MNLEELKELIEFLEKKGFVEVEYENQGVRLRLRRAEPNAGAPPPAAWELEEAPDSEPMERGRTGSGEILEGTDFITIDSPIVGTFYRAPSPGAEPFVEEGEGIEKGQVLCIIEAMKVMNEIESEVDGRIRSILAENGQPVGYGDPLFIIEPL